MATCARAAATFLWKASGCQVQVVGDVKQVSDEEADAYFVTRDRSSQIGAWASRQSEPLDSRETLIQRVTDLDREYKEKKFHDRLTGRDLYSVRSQWSFGPSGNFACTTGFCTQLTMESGRRNGSIPDTC